MRVELDGLDRLQARGLQPLQRCDGRALDHVSHASAGGFPCDTMAGMSLPWSGSCHNESRRTPTARSSSGLGSVTNTASCSPMTMSRLGFELKGELTLPSVGSGRDTAGLRPRLARRRARATVIARNDRQ